MTDTAPQEPSDLTVNVIAQPHMALAEGTTLCIAPEGRLLVRVWPDGRLEYGPDYDPDEAARIFWEAIAQWAPRTA